MLVIAPIMTAEKTTIQNIFFDFDKLIFLEFYMCEKYGIYLQRMRMQVLLKAVAMDCIKQENQ